MSTRTYPLTFAGGDTQRLPAGVFFLVKTATSALDITVVGSPASPGSFANAPAGLAYGPLAQENKWKYLDVYSAGAQSVEIVVSEESEVRFGNQVTVAGTTSTAEVPSTSIATPAAVNVANAATSTIAANASRKRIRVCALSTNTGSVFVQVPASGAGRGLELQPGLWESFVTTAALAVRNDSGAAQDYTTFEES